MSMTLSTLHFKNPIKPFSPRIPPFTRTHSNAFPLNSFLPTVNAVPFKIIKIQNTLNYSGLFKKNLGIPFDKRNMNVGFTMKAQNEYEIGTDSSDNKAEESSRGQSTMPERFRYLTKEAPDKPVRWPWLIVLGFMLYAWRTVLWELSNWRKAVSAIFGFLGYIAKLMLAIIFHFIGDPITSSIRGIETLFYTIRAYYSGIIAYAPIQELTTIIMLTSAVLAIAEATVPDSVNSQPYLLTVAGLIGYAAVVNSISEPFFWTLLLGLFGFARFIKKRDYVSSALPVAAVLSAVGEPWVRLLVMGSYLALAIFHHSKNPSALKEEEDTGTVNRVPVPLLCAALALGVRLTAKWAGYRHLTWMIV
ncbi:embryo defective [Forsythia ovata]|uniref:Embryo defective n=1 Tax=Forsythia ovata TaxID=205694 RepID=A0ABD1S835_9LAMI